MKRIRGWIALLLVVAVCFGCLTPVRANAEAQPDAYPESDHPYANNTDKLWTYTYPVYTDRLFVTFSAACEVEDKDSLYVEYYGEGYWMTSIGIVPDGTPQTICIPNRTFRIGLISDDADTGYGFSIDRISPQPPADVCAVRCAYGRSSVMDCCPADASDGGITLPGAYLFDRLKTAQGVLIGWEAPGGNRYYYTDDRDRLPLISPEDLVPGELVDFSPVFCPNEETYTVNIRYDGRTQSATGIPGRTLHMSTANFGTITEEGAIYGWRNDDGVEYQYPTDTLTLDNAPYTPAGGETVTLTTPLVCPLSVRPEETFAFDNDNGKDDYFMTASQKRQLFKNYTFATMLTPFAPIGALLGLITATIYPRWPQNGVCCAFPQLILMQHAGKIDLPAIQGVENMDELQLWDPQTGEVHEELVGTLSYYNGASQAAFVCCNMAIEPGSDAFKAQSQALYDAVESGKPAVIFYFPGKETHPFSSARAQQTLEHLKNRDLYALVEGVAGMHSVLLTGAYTALDGRHIFFGYDSNGNSKQWGIGYVSGEAQVFELSADFGNFELGPYNWTTDPAVFTPFRLDQTTNPLLWAKNFFRSLGALITKKPY
ncbi:MAG: hypothetical protein IJK64_04295 [Clostridia bacterium]|nr:hypothetical protein [Clostridia bacterium]